MQRCGVGNATWPDRCHEINRELIMNDDQQNAILKRRASRMTVQAGIALLLACGSTAFGATSLEDKVLAGPCVNCHGPDGRSPGAIPSIAGLPEAELKAKLLAFKSEGVPAGSTASSTVSSTVSSSAGATAGTTIMNRLAKGYTDDQITALSHYYAQMKPAAGVATGAKP